MFMKFKLLIHLAQRWQEWWAEISIAGDEAVVDVGAEVVGGGEEAMTKSKSNPKKIQCQAKPVNEN